jgi:hypothetical protein
MCLITMGLLAALAPAALYVGLMVWKDGGETPRRSDARAPQRTMTPQTRNRIRAMSAVALRPGMSTIPDAVLLCASTPYARRGALWDAHRRHYGQDGDEAQSKLLQDVGTPEGTEHNLEDVL